MPTRDVGRRDSAAEGLIAAPPRWRTASHAGVRLGRSVAAERWAIRKIDTIAHMASSCAGRPARALAQSLVAAVLSTTLVTGIAPLAQATAGCPESAPLVRHGPLERVPEPESGVLLRHALIGSGASWVADASVHLEEVRSVLGRIRTAWPAMTAITARPLWEPGTLILELRPALGRAVEDALAEPGARVPFCTGHVKFDALNRSVDLRAVTAFPHLPDLYRAHFDPNRDMPDIAAQYAALEGVVAAMPDVLLGDGPGIQALRSDSAWFLVFRDAWGDCPSGCMFSKLHFYVADERRIARIDRSGAVRMEEFSAILAARGWRLR